MVSERGLVVVPRFSSEDGESMRFPPRPFPFEDLRRYTLYWDRLDFPHNNVFDFEEFEEIEYLEETGVLQRTPVTIDRHQEPSPYRAYILAQLEAFHQLSAKEPGLWAIGQSAIEFQTQPDAAFPTRTVEIELYNTLPTPPDNVSLADVLEFKHRRASELAGLRRTLDILFKEISNDKDVPRAKTAALDRLVGSIVDLSKVTDEAWPGRLMSSLKIELNLPTVAAGAIVGLAVAVGVAAPGAIVAAASLAAVASVRINLKDLFAPRLPTGLTDFAYVYHQLQELR